MRPLIPPLLALGLIAGSLTAPPLRAEGASLALELNAVTQQEGGCRVTFLATNGLAAPIDALVLEAVILSPQGLVDRLALLDFQSLPQARPRVRQFDLPGLACDAIGQILINALGSCTGTSITPDSCAAALTLRSRLDTIALTG
jgi:hypothetical protein